MLKSGCYNLSADRIVAPYGLHAYMKQHDSDDSPVAAKLQRFGSFRRKALYKALTSSTTQTIKYNLIYASDLINSNMYYSHIVHIHDGGGL